MFNKIFTLTIALLVLLGLNACSKESMPAKETQQVTIDTIAQDYVNTKIAIEAYYILSTLYLESPNLDFEKSYDEKSYFSYGIEYLNNKAS